MRLSVPLRYAGDPVRLIGQAMALERAVPRGRRDPGWPGSVGDVRTPREWLG